MYRKIGQIINLRKLEQYGQLHMDKYGGPGENQNSVQWNVIGHNNSPTACVTDQYCIPPSLSHCDLSPTEKNMSRLYKILLYFFIFKIDY